jgi:hypothetical protein
LNVKDEAEVIKLIDCYLKARHDLVLFKLSEDIPNPDLLKQLTEEEQKKRLEEAKVKADEK